MSGEASRCGFKNMTITQIRKASRANTQIESVQRAIEHGRMLCNEWALSGSRLTALLDELENEINGLHLRDSQDRENEDQLCVHSQIERKSDPS